MFRPFFLWDKPQKRLGPIYLNQYFSPGESYKNSLSLLRQFDKFAGSFGDPSVLTGKEQLKPSFTSDFRERGERRVPYFFLWVSATRTRTTVRAPAKRGRRPGLRGWASVPTRPPPGQNSSETKSDVLRTAREYVRRPSTTYSASSHVPGFVACRKHQIKGNQPLQKADQPPTRPPDSSIPTPAPGSIISDTVHSVCHSPHTCREWWKESLPEYYGKCLRRRLRVPPGPKDPGGNVGEVRRRSTKRRV